MPQTETVLRQALKELVKPVLFINKVDRLIKEVKLTPEAMQEKFIKIIDHVNRLIEQIAPEGYKEKWKVGVGEGTVAFGSAFHNWALSFSYMKEKGITFKEVIDAYQGSDEEIAKNIKELAKKLPYTKLFWVCLLNTILILLMLKNIGFQKSGMGILIQKLEKI